MTITIKGNINALSVHVLRHDFDASFSVVITLLPFECQDQCRSRDVFRGGKTGAPSIPKLGKQDHTHSRLCLKHLNGMHCVTIGKHRNPFSAGALSRTPLGTLLTTLLRSSSRLGGEPPFPSPFPPPRCNISNDKI